MVFISSLSSNLHPGVLHGVTFNLIPNRMGFCHGQISIDTATYSLGSVTKLDKNLWVGLISLILSHRSVSSAELSTPKSTNLGDTQNLWTSWHIQHYPVGTGPFKQHLFNIVCKCCLNINFWSYCIVFWGGKKQWNHPYTMFKQCCQTIVYTFSSTMFK